jgi:hypothetical protein
VHDGMATFRHTLLHLLALAATSGCAAKTYVNLPIERAHSLEVRKLDGTSVRTISDPAALAALDERLNRVHGWFDDIFPRKHSVEYMVDLLHGSTVVGTLIVEQRHVRYYPGKGGAPISKRDHDDLVRILEQHVVPGVR